MYNFNFVAGLAAYCVLYDYVFILLDRCCNIVQYLNVSYMPLPWGLKLQPDLMLSYTF